MELHPVLMFTSACLFVLLLFLALVGNFDFHFISLITNVGGLFPLFPPISCLRAMCVLADLDPFSSWISCSLDKINGRGQHYRTGFMYWFFLLLLTYSWCFNLYCTIFFQFFFRWNFFIFLMLKKMLWHYIPILLCSAIGVMRLWLTQMSFFCEFYMAKRSPIWCSP